MAHKLNAYRKGPRPKVRGGGHVHQRLLGGRAKGAERYPDKLCQVIVKSFAQQLRDDTNDINTFDFDKEGESSIDSAKIDINQGRPGLEKS